MEQKNSTEQKLQHKFKSLAFWMILLAIYSIILTIVSVTQNIELQSKKAELTNLQLTYEILLERTKE